jgi:acyl dehydratase
VDDATLVGRVWPPDEPFPVTRDQIRAFATAIGATDPTHFDPAVARARGHPDLLAPPTFPVVVATAAGDRVLGDLGLDAPGVLHVAQRFTYHRPVYAGDRLLCTVTVQTVRTGAGLRTVTLRTETSTVDGEPVCADLSTLAIRLD